MSDEWLDRLIKWADEMYLPSQKDKLFKYPFFETDFEIEPFYKNYFPRDKKELRNIKGIYLEYRAIDELPDEFGNLTELEFLYIEDLKKFPNSILKLKKLKVLGLVNSYYHHDTAEFTLPKELAQLTDLRVLGFNFKCLKRFPKVILKLDKLCGLTLNSCDLKAIPRGFELLAKHMSRLYLNGNSLKNVPTALYKCKKLEFLSLCSCGLTALPKHFAHLQNLQTLKINNNKFAEFPQVIFELKNLKELYIDKHLITPDIIEKLNSKGMKLQ